MRAREKAGTSSFKGTEPSVGQAGTVKVSGPDLGKAAGRLRRGPGLSREDGGGAGVWGAGVCWSLGCWSVPFHQLLPQIHTHSAFSDPFEPGSVSGKQDAANQAPGHPVEPWSLGGPRTKQSEASK